MSHPPSQSTPPKSRTGIAGLDEILRGGLPANRFYLLRGLPGVGKTTLALQYLLEGVRHGEPALYITLSETKDEIEEVAASHLWNLDGVAIFELSVLEQQLAQESQNTIFYPSEIELNRTTDLLLAHIEKVAPRRVVLDSLSELRLLSDTPLRYRRQMLALKQYFAGKQITVVLLDDHTGESGDGDLHVQSIAHGVITIEQLVSDYGAERRRVRINKLRGVDFPGGYHDALMKIGGLEVFPRLLAAEHHREFVAELMSSGVPSLDHLLSGGLDRGTSSLLLGPAGAGKSSIAMQFAIEAAKRGERVFVYLFEENVRTMIARTESVGMPIRDFIAAGTIVVQQVDPGELTPGQFIHQVQQNVARDEARVVIIDSMNGYLQAMPDAKFLTIQLHELLASLNHYGVVTLLTVAQHGLLGQMHAPIDLTYLADTVILLRYFEQGGAIRKAVSIVKKRIGSHETTIREFRLTSHGLVVGEALKEFEGVLTGTPSFVGATSQMLATP